MRSWEIASTICWMVGLIRVSGVLCAYIGYARSNSDAAAISERFIRASFPPELYFALDTVCRRRAPASCATAPSVV
jgi:hypothetical protein